MNVERVISVCPLDCPDQCSFLVEKRDGRIVKVSGDPDHPVTKGSICNKTRQFPERVYHPDRLLYPMRRVGGKGEGRFERISWEAAYREIADRFRQIIGEWGAEAILPYSFYGNMGLLNAECMDRRFFHRLGASRLDRTICNAAGSEGYAATMGMSAGVDPEETVDAKLFLIWGSNLISTNVHQSIYAEAARKNGAKIIVIDVHQNRTARWADWFIPIRPGTDAALAMGMMHILIKEELIDRDFIDKHCVGFEALAAEAEKYDPQTVMEITGVPAEDVVRLARTYGAATPSFVRIGNGLQHHDNGGMIVRTISCLPALTGQWGVRGGGAVKGNSWYGRVNVHALQRPDLMPRRTRILNMNQLGAHLLEEASPPVKALFVYNCNPAQVAPEQSKVRKGLLRDDLFTVVHDLFLTDTAKYADLVLPATSHFENLDLYKSYWHLYLQLNEPIIPVQGEAKSNFTLFKELAGEMGFEEPCFQETEEDAIRGALHYPQNPNLDGITLERLRQEHYVKVGSKLPGRRIRLFSEPLVKKGLPGVPTHMPLREETDYPLWFIPGPNHQFLNTSFANIEKLKRLEKRPLLYMHQDDAEARGIRDGDKVRIFNDRGACRLTASVGETVLPGVAVVQGLWWEDAEDGYESVNALTPDRLSDLGGGATFFSTKIEAEKIRGGQG